MSEPDYKTIFYRSQTKFCDAINQLRDVVLKMSADMRYLEEMVISGEPEENEKGDQISD